MTDLRFEPLGVEPATYAASPVMLFRLEVSETTHARIQTIVLHVQAQLEPRTRRYSREEQARVYGLFGAPAQWDRSLRPVPWTQLTTVVPGFVGRTEIELAVPCTYDLEVGASRYFHAIREGDITVRLLFSGTVFMTADAGLAIEPVPWDRETLVRVPASLWGAVMDACVPGGGWVCLRRETIDALLAFRERKALVSWDDTIAQLLASAHVQEPS